MLPHFRKRHWGGGWLGVLRGWSWVVFVLKAQLGGPGPTLLCFSQVLGGESSGKQTRGLAWAMAVCVGFQKISALQWEG